MATKRLREIKERYIVDASGKRVGVVLDSQVYEKLVAEIESLRARNAQPRPKGRKNGARKSTAPRVAEGELSERERADEILRHAGLLGEPTAKEKQLVAEWETVPVEERARLVEEFRTAKLDRPLSEIVIENRR